MNWIRSAPYDLGLIILPGLLSVALLPFIQNPNYQLPIWGWVILVMGIDVSHVYSTLFRTYFDPKEFELNRKLYILIPLLAFTGMVILYTTSSQYFWRVLAYIAVYHFMRQQYGFFRLYSRNLSHSRATYYLENSTLAMAMIYPMIYWHTHLPRQFDWFTPSDFFRLSPILEPISFYLYMALLFAYFTREIISFSKDRIPKNLLLITTALCWYTGIVVYNGDIAFTLTNVVIHGIPYMALVYTYSEKSQTLIKPALMKGIPLFVLVLLSLAYLEEGFWDALVWRDHPEVFQTFFYWIVEVENPWLMALVVPLLSLPQVTHYIIDGFIWRLSHRDQRQLTWKNLLP